MFILEVESPSAIVLAGRGSRVPGAATTPLAPSTTLGE
jgi:hypothetical protein